MPYHDDDPNPYLIEDLVTKDPFRPIFDKHRNDIFYEYSSYHDYLNYLRMIGKRLKENYKKYGAIMPSFTRAMEIGDEGELNYLHPILQEITYEIQLDQESFVIFSKMFLDKLGLLIQKLLDVKANSYTHSFTDHKKWFIKNNNINPQYSKLLLSLYWYD